MTNRTSVPCKDCGETDWYIRPNGRDSHCRECRSRKRGGSRRHDDPMERFISKVSIDAESTCWLWIGATDRDGYGKLGFGGKSFQAHRWGYQSLVEPIRDGLVLDHLCRVRNCVNPDHLEPVTARINALRSNQCA